MSILAERPPLVQRLFTPLLRPDSGIVAVRTCHGGLWRTLTLDDYLPTEPRGGPLYAHVTGRTNTWPMFLEKACAKVFGHYDTLRAGLVSEALMDLSGGPVERIVLRGPGVDAAALFTRALDALRVGCVVALSFPGDDRGAAARIAYMDRGPSLMFSHAYAVLQAREVRGVRVVQVSGRARAA